VIRTASSPDPAVTAAAWREMRCALVRAPLAKD